MDDAKSSAVTGADIPANDSIAIETALQGDAYSTVADLADHPVMDHVNLLKNYLALHTKTEQMPDVVHPVMWMNCVGVLSQLLEHALQSDMPFQNEATKNRCILEIAQLFELGKQVAGVIDHITSDASLEPLLHDYGIQLSNLQNIMGEYTTKALEELKQEMVKRVEARTKKELLELTTMPQQEFKTLAAEITVVGRLHS